MKFFRFVKNAWLMLGITCLMLGIIEIASFFWLKKLNAGAKRSEMSWVESDSYQGQDWIQTYLQDFFRIRMEWEPYLYWKRKPFTSTYINIDESGTRRTVPSALPADGARRPKIFVFGGSTTWGEGVTDEGTIPSQLVKILDERKVPAEVINKGEGGYVSTQELMKLLRELQRGNIPDAVIYYDGFNDTYAAGQGGEAAIPHNEWNRRAEFNLSARRIQLYQLVIAGPRTGLNTVNLLNRLARGVGHTDGPQRWGATPEPGLARKVVDAYAVNCRSIKALADAYGFKALFYWQPVIYLKDKRTAFEEAMVATEPEYFRQFFSEVDGIVRADAATISPGSFHYISDIFAGHEGPLYVDFCHITEEGNRIVAQRMADDLIQAGLTARP